MIEKQTQRPVISVTGSILILITDEKILTIKIHQNFTYLLPDTTLSFLYFHSMAHSYF
jgi:hypothetical protein